MSSTRELDIKVDPSVSSVEIVLDGERVEVVRGAPWKARIDLGEELAPHELIAIARNKEGQELARDTQYINVPRPQAELGVLLQRERAEISWKHIGDRKPKKMKVKLGEKTLTNDVTNVVKLPPVSPASVNILSVDLTFEDGTHVHRDVVFGGFSEEVPAELTPTVVRERAQGRKDPASCFRLGKQPVAASAVENSDNMIFVVRHPDPPGQTYRKQNYRIVAEQRFTMPKTSLRFYWPVTAGAGGAELFQNSKPIELAAARGVRSLVMNTIGPHSKNVRLADAVAISGTEALRESRRRAVLLVLNGEEDRSFYPPEVVRQYLTRVGVPLYVWSLKGPVPGSAWGEVEDVSKYDLLQTAIEKLRADLDQQRVAWLPLDPYDALHVAAAPDCAWEPLAAGK
jgi:hypothetical protein